MILFPHIEDCNILVNLVNIRCFLIHSLLYSNKIMSRVSEPEPGFFLAMQSRHFGPAPAPMYIGTFLIFFFTFCQDDDKSFK